MHGFAGPAAMSDALALPVKFQELQLVPSYLRL